MDKEVLKYGKCFVCGDKNSHGLQARFFYNGKEAYTDITADRFFEGYHDIYHGGIIAAILDEVMIKAILADEIYAVTAELNIRFLKPAKIGDKIKFTGKVVKRKSRIFLTEGQAVNQDGNTLATATGKYIEAKDDLKQILMQSIEK